LRLLTFDRPGQRGAEVRVFAAELAGGDEAAGPADVRVECSGFGIFQIVQRVSSAPRVALAAGHQQLARVLSDGFEQTIAGVPVTFVDDDQRPVHQTCYQVEHVAPGHFAVRAHRFGRVQVAAVREHRQATERGALSVCEKSVTPVERRPQSLLARRRRAAGRAKQLFGGRVLGRHRQ
jgi:hypothetical protein